MTKAADRVLKILKTLGTIITDSHFVYTSGKHGSVYIRKDQLYPYTDKTSKVCLEIAKDVKDKNIEIVVGPALGGIVLSQWTAYHLSKLTGRQVLSVFSEKSYDDKRVYDRPQMLKRGYDKLVKGKRALIVEDLTTTGNSVKKVVNEVKKAKGKVVCVYVLVNRNPSGVNSKSMDAPFNSLAVLKADAWEPEKCPLCKKGVSVNIEVGHGKEFLMERKKERGK
jgi:orotate phosphoribosyltransferase